MIHLVLGGARSGKSRYAEQCVAEYAAIGYSCVYLATATALDHEMSARINQHQQDRMSSVHSWTLHEQAYDVGQTLVAIDKPQQVILLDCLTLLLTNHLLLNDGASWATQKSLLIDSLSALQSDVVLVSNEVGSGIVPMGELNRRFVDEAGWLNQEIAAISDQVTLVVAGLPLALKSIMSLVDDQSPKAPTLRGALMVQGTTSDAGKSTLVAGLCRLFSRQNINVAPFKPQNMALNSAVTIDGGEIGRAQALQAIACGLAPHTDFNPVLLKPSSDTGAQVIIHGKALTTLEAKAFFGPESYGYKTLALAAVMQSYRRLQQQYSLVVIEGAGSPAEINLREGDIANMGFAEEADCPVIIIADIDKGGVFAHLVGTLALLSPSEQARVKGFVINRFRGDISLLQPGIDWLEAYTNKPVLGVLPYLHDLHLYP